MKRSFTPLVLLGLLAVVLVILVFNALSFQDQLDRTRVAASDSRVWSVSQIEVDHKNLLLAVAQLRALHGSADASDAQLQKAIVDLSQSFDVFYSRADIVRSSLRGDGVPGALQREVARLLVSRDGLAQQFDAADMSSPAEVGAFDDAVMAASGNVRAIVLGALGYFVTEAKLSRKEESRISTQFLGSSLLLVAIMGAAMVVALQLRRQLLEQINLMRIASDNTRMVYEASTMGIVVTQMDGEVVLFNAAAEAMFGCSQEDVIGRDIAQTVLPDMREQARNTAVDTISVPRAVTAQRLNGSTFPAELSLRVNRDMSGDIILISFVRDVSEQRAYEENLRAARDEARRHADAKTMFLATMSHEMRTPLHGLLASLDLVDGQSVDENTANLLQIARDCGVRSLIQINEVLELTRIDEMREIPTVFAPARMVSGILGELRALAKDNGNQLNMNVTGDSADSQWAGMPKTFTRVLYNLIGNALKFTTDGWVSVTLDFARDTTGSARLVVNVQDTGVGISPEDQAQIFSPFFISANVEGQGKHSSVEAKSTGLGLPIAQLGVEKMGGTLALESALGRGSRFYFEIPLEDPDSCAELPATVKAEAAASQFNFNALVVDDNTVNLELTAKMIGKLGCKAAQASGGKDAVAMARDEQFDVIFMDLNMPGLSGWEAAKQIRKAGASKGATIVALTADVTTDANSLTEESGIDMVLHKPALITDFAGIFLQVGEDGDDLDDAGAGLEEDAGDMLSAAAPPKPAAVVLDLSELAELLGHDRLHGLLEATMLDVDGALGAITAQGTDMADVIHRAIGSTAVVGLAELSAHLRHAENLARAQSYAVLRGYFNDVQAAADYARVAVADGLARAAG